MTRDRSTALLMGAGTLVVLVLLFWMVRTSGSSAAPSSGWPLEDLTPLPPSPMATEPRCPTVACPTVVCPTAPPCPPCICECATPEVAYPLPPTPELGTPEPYPGVTPTPSATGSATPARSSTPTLTATPSPWAPDGYHLPLITRRHTMATPAPTLTPTPTRTPTPTVTPTPTRPWPEALSEPGPSKLGLHIQWNNSPDILEFIRRYRPSVVKGVGDVSYMAEVKALSPTTVTVARPQGGDPTMDEDPIQAARDYVARHLAYYRDNPGVDYWEGLNEPNAGDHIEWLAAFEAERVRVMAQHGLRAAVGAFSTGVPEWEDFRTFLPAVEAAYRHGGILTLHEYDAPTMQRSVGMALPGMSARSDSGTLLLRYRWWYEDLLRPRGIVVPLVISEAGVDGGIPNRPGPRGLGWRDFTGYWGDQGLGTDGVRMYLDQLAWYDAELRRDDYVVGCAIFTAGAMGSDWASFDVTDILRDIGAYMVAEAKAAAPR